MLTRRTLVASCGAIAAGFGAPARATGPSSMGLLRFDVLRNDGRIGQHVVRLLRDGDAVRAEITVEIAIGIGPITVYRYSHAVREEWRDGLFQWMESRTNDDGTRHEVRAERTAEGVRVRRLDGESLLAAGTIPLTHWNYQCMRAKLFNPQTGLPLQLSARPRETDILDLGNGRTLRARRYEIEGETQMQTWYDAEGTWRALQSVGRDRSMIRYRPIA